MTEQMTPERIDELNKQLAAERADLNKRFQETWDEENARWKALNNDAEEGKQCA